MMRWSAWSCTSSAPSRRASARSRRWHGHGPGRSCPCMVATTSVSLHILKRRSTPRRPGATPEPRWPTTLRPRRCGQRLSFVQLTPDRSGMGLPRLDRWWPFRTYEGRKSDSAAAVGSRARRGKLWPSNHLPIPTLTSVSLAGRVLRPSGAHTARCISKSPVKFEANAARPQLPHRLYAYDSGQRRAVSLERVEAMRHEEIEIDLPPSSLEQRTTLEAAYPLAALDRN
jgi:hypothetical protein